MKLLFDIFERPPKDVEAPRQENRLGFANTGKSFDATNKVKS